jgi:hypothetical protein
MLLRFRYIVYLITVLFLFTTCGKKAAEQVIPTPPRPLNIRTISIQQGVFNNNMTGVGFNPVIQISFNEPIRETSIRTAIGFGELTGNTVDFDYQLQSGDSVLRVQPKTVLKALTRYRFMVSNALTSSKGASLSNTFDQVFSTQIDSAFKFPVISDEALLNLVQQQTFRYFWNFAHPVSGLIWERDSSGDLVTSGGSGFGLMAMIVGVQRNFITRADALTRANTIVDFLKNKATKFHGAFPHWLNGITGAVIPFSQKDNGADLVETSYLIMGLLTVRQFFNGSSAPEIQLRKDITDIYDAVEWGWFRKNNEQVLYWHWSPTFNWDINLPVRGWNECLITYVLAASSTKNGIPKEVYHNGWASNGAQGFVNRNSYFNIRLPLGPAFGGPLFFSHYSFLGINPRGLKDQYADYEEQVKHHTLINYQYCLTNPSGQYGYSNAVWGLTASDVPGGYAASSPTRDIGVIAPTAALSSIPFTPEESMRAMRFFYYVLGDRLWKSYGFIDAFSLKESWFASSFLAIDQGPIIIMIENYRSGLLWQLFTSCEEVKNGMRVLGFTAPYL